LGTLQVSNTIVLVCDSADATLKCGRVLGETLPAGAFVAISGPLGAGKTVLVKGMALGLGVSADEPVVSPTFVLAREYRGRFILYHLDAYRLDSDVELLGLGLDEMAERPDAVVALEWADRVPEAVPPGAWRIEMAHVSPTTRLLRLDVPDQRCRDELITKLTAGSGGRLRDV